MPDLQISDLHLALLILAAVLLAALYLYGKWQERRAIRKLEASLRQGVGDPLMAPPDAARAAAGDVPAPAPRADAQPAGPAAPRGRIEPRFSDLDFDAGESGSGTAVARWEIEPRHDLPAAARGAARREPRGGLGESGRATAATAAAGAWIEDPMLDCVFELRCAHAVDGVAVLDAAGALARLQGSLPVHLAAWDARRQHWVQPDRFGFYAELLIATQIAARRHALDEIEASRFVAAVQQVALALDADFDPPDVAQMVAMATELEATCGRFDVQIGITLEPLAGPWHAERLAQAAADAGLVAYGPGRWGRVPDDGVALFTLACTSLPAERLMLELDVPLVPAAAEPLRAMAAAAEELAADLDARIVDDNQRPIDATSLAAIDAQLQSVYVQMREAGIEAGSLRARRLYG